MSLFSGAGISDVGFDRAGWECAAQVEIDKQANRVRKMHFPNVRHFEDIRSFDAREFRGVDAVIGGFPCQDYSVAGRRAGLAGDRGALWWEFHRVIRETMPQFIVGENVPGLLSSDGGRSFGTILSSLVQLGYGVAWRILDLRYFRVPQRRRRVFIVGSLGDGRASEILFEPDCLRRYFEASGEEGEEVAGTLGGGSGQRGWRNDLDSSGAYIAGTLAANGGGLTRPAGNCNETDFCVPVPLCSATRGANANADRPSLGEPDGPMFGLTANDSHGVAIPFAQNSRDEVRCLGNATGALAAEPGMKQQTYLAFTSKDSGSDCGEISPTLRGMGHDESHANGGGQVAIADGWQVRRLTVTECERFMGLPDGYTEGLADGPRYKMLGNGWAVPQAEWIARRILEAS